MKNPQEGRSFVVCIHNYNCEDLELRKTYEVLPDQMAEQDGYIRVVDESGEDYLYPSDYFLAIEGSKDLLKSTTLGETMKEVSENAKRRGLTSEILDSILRQEMTLLFLNAFR